MTLRREGRKIQRPRGYSIACRKSWEKVQISSCTGSYRRRYRILTWQYGEDTLFLLLSTFIPVNITSYLQGGDVKSTVHILYNLYVFCDTAKWFMKLLVLHKRERQGVMKDERKINRLIRKECL